MKVSRLSSLKWMGFQSAELGFAKPVRMNRHEETKKVVAALMSPVAEETMRPTDACWSAFLISSNLQAPPTPFGDADLIAFSGGLATRAYLFRFCQSTSPWSYRVISGRGCGLRSLIARADYRAFFMNPQSS